MVVDEVVKKMIFVKVMHINAEVADQKNTCLQYNCTSLDAEDVFKKIDSDRRAEYHTVSVRKCMKEISKCEVTLQQDQGQGTNLLTGSSKPNLNIVFSLVDDMGWSDIGYENENIKTDFLDGLANTGIKLDRHYAFRFCSPSRSMIMTGYLPWRHGQQTDINLNPVSAIRCGVQTDMYFLPQQLKASGYQTAMVGKWHLGHYSISHTPTLRGFDQFVGLYSGGTPPMNKFGKKMFQHNRCWCQSGNDKSCTMYGQLKKCVDGVQLVNNTKQSLKIAPVESFENEEFSDLVLAREAVRMIKNHDETKGPLFLFASWFSPHNPIMSPERYQDMNPGVTDVCRKQYAGMMSAVDEANKQVVDALKKREMWENTLFIFTSDNGGFNRPDRPCNQPMSYQGSNFPLRGSKFTFWEGGIRVKSFIHSPSSEIIPISRRGKTWSGLTSLTDWFQTVVTAAELPEMEANLVPPDSISFWNEIISDSESPRASLNLQVWKEGSFERFVGIKTSGGKLFKYIKGYPGFKPGNPQLGYQVPYDKWDPMDGIWIPPELRSENPNPPAYPKYVCEYSACLFNLDDDPTELNNLVQNGNKTDQQLAEEIGSNLLILAETEMVTLPESGLCGAGFVTQPNRRFTDPAAYDRAKYCGYFLPWLDQNMKLIPNRMIFDRNL